MLQFMPLGLSDERVIENLVDLSEKPPFQGFVLSGKFFKVLFELRRSMKIVFHRRENFTQQEFSGIHPYLRRFQPGRIYTA